VACKGPGENVIKMYGVFRLREREGRRKVPRTAARRPRHVRNLETPLLAASTCYPELSSSLRVHPFLPSSLLRSHVHATRETGFFPFPGARAQQASIRRSDNFIFESRILGDAFCRGLKSRLFKSKQQRLRADCRVFARARQAKYLSK